MRAGRGAGRTRGTAGGTVRALQGGASAWGCREQGLPCGVEVSGAGVEQRPRVGLWGRGAEGRSVVKVPGAAVGKSPRVGCGGLGLGWGRIPVRGCAGGKQPGGTQGLPLAGSDAGTCHLPTRCPPSVSPEGDTGHTGALTSRFGVGKVRAEGHRNLSWWMSCFTFSIIFLCKSHLWLFPSLLSDRGLLFLSLNESG